jgi:hypothetical protein
MTLDLPTFERPKNATSGKLGAGKWDELPAAVRNLAKTLMLKFAMRRLKLARAHLLPFALRGDFNKNPRPVLQKAAIPGRGSPSISTSEILRFENDPSVRSSQIIGGTGREKQFIGCAIRSQAVAEGDAPELVDLDGFAI